MDDEVLRRIFKMAQPLMVNDLQRDKDGAAVEPPSVKGGDLRRYNREDAVDTPLQMKGGQRSNERISVKDLSLN